MDDFEWTAINESKLLEAMVGHKPIGINKYFEMACICEKLHELNDFEIPSDKIWSHLGTLYNLEALNELESMPFPNEEKEFMLPDVDYASLKVKKEDKVEEKNGKSVPTKRSDTSKEVVKSTNSKEVKKEEKVIKKETPRRDSKDGKELKVNVGVKKEVKKETVDNKSKNMKSRSSSSLKEEEKSKTPNRLEEIKRMQNKRPTRASISNSISLKPDEPSTPNLRKSQSPLTIASNTAIKRRRI